MEIQRTECAECGAPVMRVRILDTQRTILLDAEPAQGGVWRVYADRDTGDANATYRIATDGLPYYRSHDYTCSAVFQLKAKQ